MARSEYNDGKADNLFKDKGAGRGEGLSAGACSAKAGDSPRRLKAGGSATPSTAAIDGPPDGGLAGDGLRSETSEPSLENRLQHRLALVDVRGGKSGRKGHNNKPAFDPYNLTSNGVKADAGVKKERGISDAVPRSYEITDALDFANIANAKHGVGGNLSQTSEADTPKHPPSTEAMKWDAIEGRLKGPPSVTEVADNLKKLAQINGGQSATGEGAATASFNLMSALENSTAQPAPASGPAASHSPSSLASALNPPPVSNGPDQNYQPDSMDSMENSGASVPPNSTSPHSQSDGRGGSMDSMEFGMEPLPEVPGIDDEMRSSRAQLDMSLANLVAENKNAHQSVTHPPLVSNALTADADQSKGQLMVRLDLDNDPPPLSNHLSRAAPNPNGNRSMIIAGFLGGLSIAFISIWGYIYTLPIDDKTSSNSSGQRRAVNTVDRSKLVLKVDNLRWQSGKALPLKIKIGGDGSTSGLLVKLAGLPGDARLSNGFPTGNGEWIVPASKLFGLTLSLTRLPEKTITVGVSLLEQNRNTETGHFSSFSIYPEKLNRVATTSVHKVIAANAGMAAIPMPRLVDDETKSGESAGTPSAFAAKGAVPVIEADDEAFGGLPEDFEVSNITGRGAVNSTFQRASRQALSTPPARAKQFANGNEQGWGGAAQVGATSRGTSRSAHLANSVRHITNTDRASIRLGNQHMRGGDIVKARRLYEKAYKKRAPEAAMALGRSYDPNYLGRIANANAEADGAKAMTLYREAFSGGLETAQIKIDQLAKTMKQP